MTSLMKQNGSSWSIPTLFDDFWTRDLFNWPARNAKFSGVTLPAVNIHETNEDFQIEVAAPGMRRDDFKVEFSNNTLTISSEKQKEVPENIVSTLRSEFNYMAFQRSFMLPENMIESARISARYKDGILLITVPKQEEARQKPAKRISIS